jgi:phosphatidylinositol glycan class O
VRGKTVLIVLDAMRYDFAENQSWSKRGLLLRSRADPPTTTLQRLEALLTGSLPTFIDASLNFADTNHLHTDNIVRQLVAANRRIHFMGDDTWLSLFNESLFAKADPFPSFEVWYARARTSNNLFRDLHSVDNGIVDILYDQIRAPDWDVIVAHFLGVDHAGHRYGPNHIEMKKKLAQVDIWINKLLDEVSDDTIVYIIGDHGMDDKG